MTLLKLAQNSLIITAILLLNTRISQAQVPTHTFSGGNTWSVNGGAYGYDITFSQAVTITEFGIWIGERVGTQARNSGIYNLSGNLLGFATVTPGGATESGFRYGVLTTPLDLPAGTYRLAAAYNNADHAVGNDSTILTAAGAMLGTAYELESGSVTNSGELKFPTSEMCCSIFRPGPNAKFVFAAPEPDSFILLLAGIGVILLRRRKGIRS